MRPQRTMLTGAAITALAVTAGPAHGAPAPRHLTAQAAASAQAPSSVVFGAITPQSWPVVVALNKARNRVDHVAIGLDMTCTSGDSFGTSDGFQELKLSRRGRFTTTYGPQRIDAGGVPADVESKVVGRMSSDRGSMRGMWSLKITIYEPTGTTALDTCDSGLVRWTATQ